MNIRRDRVVKSELQDANVKCLVIWECSIKKMRKNPEFCSEILNIITDFLIHRTYIWKSEFVGRRQTAGVLRM